MSGPGARELIDLVADAGTFRSWDASVDLRHHPTEYRAELQRAAERSGVDESVLTGRALVRGRDVALIVSEFAFLGGSIGVDAGKRIIAAVRRATSEGLPLLAATASGGTRMQEGTVAFLQLAEIGRALTEHKSAGLPYLVYLRHPTTGGVLATWGSLGSITVAEPGALIAFLGPRVVQTLGADIPREVQSAENLARVGVIDGVVPPNRLAELINRVLCVARGGVGEPWLVPRPERELVDVPAMTAIADSRRLDRPGVRELLRHGGRNIVLLRGDGEGRRGRAVLVALAELDGVPCVVAGQDRRAQRDGAPLGPDALREARRAMQLASELRLPLVTVVDTPGADLSAAAEESALAGEIARSMAALVQLRVPTVAILAGEGCGGGALALFPAQRIVAAESAWLAPLPPEGASAILYGDGSRAAEIADLQGIRARDLAAIGAIHAVVPEVKSDEGDPAALARALVAAAAEQLRQLSGSRPVRD